MTREEVSRNVLLWGDDNQNALQQLSVGIVGTTQSAQLLAVSILSLGLGKVMLIGNTRAARKGRDFLIPEMKKGDSLVKTFANALSALFPHSEIIGYHTPPIEAVLYRELPRMLFNLSDNPTYASRTAKLGRMYRRPTYIGTHTANSIGISRISRETPTPPVTTCANAESSLAGMLAALCAEEVRKHAFSMDDNDRPIAPGQALEIRPAHYNTTLEESDSLVRSERILQRLGLLDGEKDTRQRRVKKPRFLLVGAGALGTFLALYLATDIRCVLDIYDGDTVEASNLNRQFLFRGAEGKPKAKTLASRLMEIVPKCEVNGINKMVDESILHTIDKKYDLILSCVDNIETRLVLSRYAAEHNIPLINGGTSSLGGTLQMYLPGKTPSLDCQAGLEALLEEERANQEEWGCALANPSVVMPNAAIAGLMAYYAKKILEDTASPCTARYHSFAETRVYFEKPHT